MISTLHFNHYEYSDILVFLIYIFLLANIDIYWIILISLNILDTSLLLDIYFANILSQSVAYLFFSSSLLEISFYVS